MAESLGRGTALTTMVENLFRTSGFVVQRKVGDPGDHFDLVASRHDHGTFGVKIAVSCPSGRSGSVSRAAVINFLNAWRAVGQPGGFTHGMIVANQTFSASATAAVHGMSGVRLVNLADLEGELLGSQPYLQNSIRNYRSQIKGRLIELSADELIMNDLRHVPFIAHHIIENIRKNRESFSFLLGDFGSGKTTVAEQIHRSLADDYISSGKGLFPFILYLRNLAQFDTDKGFIEAQIANQSPNAPSELFDRIQSLGDSVLILDGLDEVAAHSTAEDRFRLFSRVMRITQKAKHLVITSRPTHFNSLDELNVLVRDLISRDFKSSVTFNQPSGRLEGVQSVLDRVSATGRSPTEPVSYRLFPPWTTRLYYIRPLSKEDVIEYLSAYESEFNERHNCGSEKVYDYLSHIYDLTDLITRPLLLQMIVEVLIDSQSPRLDDPDLEVGPARLYQTYVTMHLNRDYTVRRFLEREERLTFARAAAVAMLETGGSLEATYENVEMMVERGLKGIPKSWRSAELKGRMSEVVSDVRVCSFINITPNDRIEFSHQSFMEYLVSDVIVEKLMANETIEEFDKELNYEILYFVGSHSLLGLNYAITLRDHLPVPARAFSARYISNVGVALLYSERSSTGKSFSDIAFNRAVIRKREFKVCSFNRVAISQITLDAVEFVACEFADTALTGVIANTLFADCTGTLEIGSVLRGVRIKGGRLSITGFQSELRFDGGEWDTIDLELHSDAITVANLSARGGSLKIEGSGYFRLENAVVHGAKIVAGPPSGIPHAHPPLLTIGGGIVDSLVAGFRINADTFDACVEELRTCRGVIYVEGSQRVIAKIFKGTFEVPQRTPKWVVIGRMAFIASTFRPAIEGRLAELCQIAWSGNAADMRQWLSHCVMPSPKPANHE